MTTIVFKPTSPSSLFFTQDFGQKGKIIRDLFKGIDPSLTPMARRQISQLILSYKGDDVEDLASLGSSDDLLKILKERELASEAAIIDGLFNKYAASEMGFFPISRALLQMRPEAIYQTIGQEVSFYAQAILQGHDLKAQFFLQAMRERHIGLTDADQWIQRTMEGDCDFTQEDFLMQPIGLCQQMYQVANMHSNMRCVQKLRDYGMQEVAMLPEGLALFSCTMDVVDIADALIGFLKDLRGKGLLLTREEFRQKECVQYYAKGPGRSNDGLGRILGRDLIERTAKRLHLSHVKVPWKTAVIPEDEELTFGIKEEWGPESSLSIYAEKITKILRKATREEMLETLTLIEEVGFCDSLSNVWVGRNSTGEEGIFFIDTEYRAFSSLPAYSDMRNLENLMDLEDREWFFEEITRRQKLFEPLRAEKEAGLKSKQKERARMAKKQGYWPGRNLTIPIDQFFLSGQKKRGKN